MLPGFYGGWKERILTLPSIAKLPERGCVVLDQPQRVGKHRGIGALHGSSVVTLLRLVCDTAALQSSVEMRPDGRGVKIPP